MNIELKKIKVLLSNSQETICFTAIGSASNSGRGGATNCYPELRVLYNQAETYLEANRTEPTFDGVMADFVDNAIDDYLEKKEIEKAEKKIAKDMLTGIVFGTKTEYTVSS
jgi:hypothetical protein